MEHLVQLVVADILQVVAEVVVMLICQAIWVDMEEVEMEDHHNQQQLKQGQLILVVEQEALQVAILMVVVGL
jgi:hypothetical protein